MKFSIYGFLFNATKNSFDLDGMVKNFTDFAEEVVIATIPSEDDTYERLSAYQNQLGVDRFKVIMTDIRLSNNRFDGDLKTAALKACSQGTIKIIADADEKFLLSQKALWVMYAEHLSFSEFDGFYLPVVDLFGDRDHIRAESQIGLKFRMHKDTVVKRGVLPGAEYGNGHFDVTKSDSSEPLRADGTLARFAHVISNPINLSPLLTSSLTQFPIVIHEGWLDLARRAKINKEFWKTHWENREGRELHDIITDEREFNNVSLIKHNISLL